MAKRKPDYRVAMKPGETHLFPRLDKPEVWIVGRGRSAYLWVGGSGCVGTVSGKVTLTILATEILARVKGNATRSVAP